MRPEQKRLRREERSLAEELQNQQATQAQPGKMNDVDYADLQRARRRLSKPEKVKKTKRNSQEKKVRVAEGEMVPFETEADKLMYLANHATSDMNNIALTVYDKYNELAIAENDVSRARKHEKLLLAIGVLSAIYLFMVFKYAAPAPRDLPDPHKMEVLTYISQEFQYLTGSLQDQCLTVGLAVPAMFGVTMGFLIPFFDRISSLTEGIDGQAYKAKSARIKSLRKEITVLVNEINTSENEEPVSQRKALKGVRVYHKHLSRQYAQEAKVAADRQIVDNAKRRS